MEKNKVDGTKNNKMVLCIVIIAVIILAVIGCYFLFNKDKPTSKQKVVETEEDSNKYVSVLDKKILKSDLNLSDNAVVYSSKVLDDSNVIFLNITEPDFQYETFYLLCFDKSGKLILDERAINDSENGNNKYKFTGEFDYDEDKKILTFNTKLFLGEGENSSGAEFDYKDISELTKDEKNTLGNYSDIVQYQYKYESKKFNFVIKNEISKLKDNEYYKDVFSTD